MVLAQGGGRSIFSKFLSKLKEDWKNSNPLEDAGASLEEHHLLHQEVPMEFIALNIPMVLKKDYSALRFHVAEGCDRPCDVPEIGNKDFRCLSLGIHDPNVKCKDCEIPIFLGRNWYCLEHYNNALIRWMSNDATILLHADVRANAFLSLQILSFHRPRNLDIFIKHIHNTPVVDECLEEVTSRPKDMKMGADKDALRINLDGIVEELRRNLDHE